MVAVAVVVVVVVVVVLFCAIFTQVDTQQNTVSHIFVSITIRVITGYLSICLSVVYGSYRNSWPSVHQWSVKRMSMVHLHKHVCVTKSSFYFILQVTGI